MPAGFSTTRRWASSYSTRRGRSSGIMSRGTGGGTTTIIGSPPFRRVDGRTISPASRTFPSSINRCPRAREIPGIASGRYRSRRSPARSAGTVSRCVPRGPSVTLPDLRGDVPGGLEQDIHQRLVEIIRALRDLGIDTAQVVALSLLDLPLQEIEQGVVPDPLLDLLRVVKRDVRDNAPGDPPGHVRVLHHSHRLLLPSLPAFQRHIKLDTLPVDQGEGRPPPGESRHGLPVFVEAANRFPVDGEQDVPFPNTAVPRRA